MRYELEPHLDDVFLEGEFDKEIVDLAMESIPAQFRPTYLVQDIEIDPLTLAERGLTSGNRQRLIALSAELELPQDTPVRFLVDSDFDHWLDDIPDYSGLVRTKYCDTETAFLTEDFVRNIVLNAGRAKIDAWNDFIVGASFCVRQLYCLRFEICVAKIDQGLIDYTRCLNWQGDSPVLNLEQLMQRSLNGVLNAEERAALFLRVNERIDMVAHSSVRLTARGHDFLNLLAWSIKTKGGARTLSTEDSLSRLLVLFADNCAGIILEPFDQELLHAG